MGRKEGRKQKAGKKVSYVSQLLEQEQEGGRKFTAKENVEKESLIVSLSLFQSHFRHRENTHISLMTFEAFFHI